VTTERGEGVFLSQEKEATSRESPDRGKQIGLDSITKSPKKRAGKKKKIVLA